MGPCHGGDALIKAIKISMITIFFKPQKKLKRKKPLPKKRNENKPIYQERKIANNRNTIWQLKYVPHAGNQPLLMIQSASQQRITYRHCV